MFDFIILKMNMGQNKKEVEGQEKKLLLLLLNYLSDNLLFPVQRIQKTKTPSYLSSLSPTTPSPQFLLPTIIINNHQCYMTLNIASSLKN